MTGRECDSDTACRRHQGGVERGDPRRDGSSTRPRPRHRHRPRPAAARAAPSTQLTNAPAQQSTGALNLMEVQWDTQASGINELSAHEIIESRRSIKTVAAQSGRRGARLSAPAGLPAACAGKTGHFLDRARAERRREAKQRRRHRFVVVRRAETNAARRKTALFL